MIDFMFVQNKSFSLKDTRNSRVSSSHHVNFYVTLIISVLCDSYYDCRKRGSGNNFPSENIARLGRYGFYEIGWCSAVESFE